MTLQDLQDDFPDATESTWHQHPNGGGWIENTAYVDASAYVGPYAVVFGHYQNNVSMDVRTWLLSIL